MSSHRTQSAVAPHDGGVDGAAVFHDRLQRSYAVARKIYSVNLITDVIYDGTGCEGDIG